MKTPASRSWIASAQTSRRTDTSESLARSRPALARRAQPYTLGQGPSPPPGARVGAAPPRSTDRRRCLVPPPGGRDLAHAHRRGDDLRGPAAALHRGARAHPLAPAPRAALPAEARLPPARDRPAAVDRRPDLQPRVPRAPQRAARARDRAAAVPARGADRLSAARPLQAAVGVLVRRGARGRPLRAHLQDPSRARRRRRRRRPRDGPVRPGARPAASRRSHRGSRTPSRRAPSCSPPASPASRSRRSA